MAAVLVASTGAGAVGDGSDVVTTAIDTTTADFIIACLHRYAGTENFADSEANTWVPLTEIAVTASTKARFFYCLNPSVSATHTFSSTTASGSTVPTITVLAYSGMSAYTYDAENGAGIGTGSTLSTGSVTPSASGAMVFAALTDVKVGAVAIDAGFTIGPSVNFASSFHMSGRLAYLEQGAAAAVNPEWSTITTPAAAVIAAFIPPASSGNRRRRVLLCGSS